MCGIVGYVGERDCTEVLLDALSKLEYRGYDSAGIAVFENGTITVEKSKGELQNLRNKLMKIINRTDIVASVTPDGRPTASRQTLTPIHMEVSGLPLYITVL